MNLKSIAAVLVVSAMVLASIPIASSSDADTVQDDQPSAQEDLPPIRLVDNGDNSYTVQSDYLMDVFGIDGSEPSEVDDPIGSGAIGIYPQELVLWYGGSNPVYDVREANSSTVIRHEQSNVSTDSNHSISFSASLTRSNNDAFTGYDTSSRWNDSGFALQDWFCDLYYDNGNGHLMLSVFNGENHSRVSVDTLAGTSPYGLDQINRVTSIQSANILNYAVGDFDGDGNDEIAIHHWYGVYVFGLDQSTLALELEDSYDVPRYSGYDNNLFTPVSMAAGDADHDGDDEVLITRGYYSGNPGWQEFTSLGILSSQSNGSMWFDVKISDPKNNSVKMDSVMTSVGCGDVDNDGFVEIVIGGYLWDNKQSSTGYTSSWAYSTGELYLAFAEPLQLLENDVSWKAVTILGDDNGTASTRFISDNKDFEKKYNLSNHNVADTSIYQTDENDNPTRLCRSVNWSNWTIPLAVGSLGGFENSNTMDEVYFDKWFYKLDMGQFAVYKKTPQLTLVVDDNNVMCVNVNVGQILNQDPSSNDTTENFMVFYAADLEKSYDGGLTEWAFVIYGNSSGVEASRTYSVDLPAPYRDLRDYGLYNVGRAFIGNYDNDAYYADISFRFMMYTDPSLIAVIEAVPFEQDLADVLFGGSGAIGTTDYTKYTSSEVSEESSVSIDLSASGGFGKKVHASLGAGAVSEGSWTTTSTLTLSTSYQSSHASAAIYVVPVDVYVYKVYVPNGDKYDVGYDYVPFFSQPVQTILEYSEYCEFIDNYNSLLEELDEGLEPVPKVELLDSVEGDIYSYYKSSNAPIHEVQVYYDGAGTSSKVLQSVDSSDGSTDTVLKGSSYEIKTTVELLMGFASIEGSVNMSSTEAVSETDVTGMSFTSELSQGMGVDYLGDFDEIDDVLGQYSMRGSIWTECRSLEAYGDDQDYIYVGYSVKSHYAAPELGAIVPNIYVPDGNDEDDKYNPTEDSVSLKLTIPGYSDKPDRSTDKCLLQVSWQGEWYTVDKSLNGFLGFVCYTDQDGEWVMNDGVFYPEAEDRDIWVKVEGLSNVSDMTFDFRLNSVCEQTGREGFNPTLPVIAYKDSRVYESRMVGAALPLSSFLEVSDLNGIQDLVIDLRSHSLGDRTRLYANTGLEAGEKVNLWLNEGQKGFRQAKTMLTVCDSGYIMWEHDAPSEGYDGKLTMAMSAFILAGCVAFLVAFYRRG